MQMIDIMSPGRYSLLGAGPVIGLVEIPGPDPDRVQAELGAVSQAREEDARAAYSSALEVGHRFYLGWDSLENARRAIDVQLINREALRTFRSSRRPSPEDCLPLQDTLSKKKRTDLNERIQIARVKAKKDRHSNDPDTREKGKDKQFELDALELLGTDLIEYDKKIPHLNEKGEKRKKAGNRIAKDLETRLFHVEVTRGKEVYKSKREQIETYLYHVDANPDHRPLILVTPEITDADAWKFKGFGEDRLTIVRSLKEFTVLRDCYRAASHRLPLLRADFDRLPLAMREQCRNLLEKEPGGVAWNEAKRHAKKGIPTEAQVLKETPYRYADKTFFEIDEVRNAVVEGLRISQILQYQG
ncbi:MAG TPA: hypothetical protein VGZ00_07285, partial [Candidatus Baltobacteraceae bacterium]|nr:hypothetical protein [Candidatus Baltobacteraceae bacterium]